MNTYLKLRKNIIRVSELFSERVWFTFSILATIFIILGGYIYYQAEKQVTNSLSEQIFHRQQLALRAGSQTINTFVELVGKSMKILSSEESLIGMSKDSQGLLNTFVNDWKNTPVKSIGVVNKDGMVEYFSDYWSGTLKGEVDVSDRDYFIHSINNKSGSVYVAKPVIAREIGEMNGKYILPLSIPIIEGNNVKGVLVVGILISDLAKAYIEPLKISEESDVYFVSKTGEIMYSSKEGITGLNLLSLLESENYKGSKDVLEIMKVKITQKEESKMLLNIPSNPNIPDKLEGFLFSSVPIEYDPNLADFSFLVQATPLSHTSLFFGPFSSMFKISTIVFLAYVSISSIVAIFVINVIKRYAFLEGYIKAKKEKTS